MYSKILSDINQPYYKNNFENDGQRFVAWYLRNIHNLDTYQTKDCLTDGANDKQIDAVYIDDRSCTIFIIQGKFYKGDTVDAEPLREVLSSCVQIKDLEHLQDGANQKLKIKICEIAKALEDDYEICFELITTANLTESANADLQLFQKELADNENIGAHLVVIDNDTLKLKYDEAININRAYIDHDFTLEPKKYMELEIGNTKVVIAAIPLKECITIPGIKDGSLFRKNVRQSLGTNNKVNKGIAQTIKNNADEFFFLHNGITAICSSMKIHDNVLSVKELNVVNGCQSLNTIYVASESAKKACNAYIMFRFYEISNSDRADKISTSTNSQSTVKARDLRSNDKSVIAIKKSYEICYPDGYFITKRGEIIDTVKYNSSRIVNLTDLGKQLITWHSQRPTIAYSETKIFDKYFDQLFHVHKDYPPENVLALHTMYTHLMQKWTSDNPMGLNETLLAMKAYAPLHQFYAISYIFCRINKMNDSVPSPSVALERLSESNLVDTVVKLAGDCLNMAIQNASREAQENERIFVPQNWIKSKTSMKDLRCAIDSYLNTLKIMPNGDIVLQQLEKGLKMDNKDFSERWTAD